MSRHEKSETDVPSEYFRRYLILGSRIPVLKVPLFFIGIIGVTAKLIEKSVEERKAEQARIKIETDTAALALWAGDD